MSEPLRSRPWVAIVGLYVVVCLIWGTTWLGIKFAVTDLPPLLAAGLRFLIATPILLGLCWFRRVPVLFTRAHLGFAAFVTLCYFAIPYLLLNVGEQYVSSGLTAICFSTVTILIVVLSVPMLGTRLTAGQVVGVVVAFSALVLLVLRIQDVSVTNGWGVVTILGAAFMHSYAYLYIKKHGGQVHVLTLNTLPLAAAGVMLTIAGLLTDSGASAGFTTRAVLATLYLGLVASALGFLGYFWLLQRLSAVTMSFIFVIFPVVAMLFSAAVEQTVFTPLDILLMFLILGAFAWTQLSPRLGARRAAPEEPPTPAQLRQLYAAAERAYPAECCGFVRRSGVRECVNVIDEQQSVSDRTATTGYVFSPADLLELSRSFDGDDPVVLIYHSHPDAGAYFSDEDQRHAVIDGLPVYPVDHLVIDVTAERAKGARRFRFSEAEGRYVESGAYGEPRPRQAQSVADRLGDR
ncbi:EamA family transporter [Nonomuraea rubra]|uniref:EamA family transporter n=1 Tax=Nonomuraea rubra TaxID=46180 RepID=UPI0033C18671